MKHWDAGAIIVLIFWIVVTGLLIYGGVKLYDEGGWGLVSVVALGGAVSLAIALGGTGGVRGVVGVMRNIDDDGGDADGLG